MTLAAAVGRAPGGPRPPRTSRGRRTRDALLQAARAEFEELGYGQSGIVGITRRAGVANGTFYFYFSSKEDVFLVVMETVFGETYGQTRPPRQGDPAARIASANRSFMDVYGRYARFMRVVNEAAGVSEAVRLLTRDVRRAQVSEVAARLQRMRAEGLLACDFDDLEPLASVLSGMMQHAAGFVAFLDEDVDRERLQRALDHTWERALGLLPAAPASTGPAEGS